MSFLVETFYVADDGQTHPWSDPITIALDDFQGYASTARDIIEGLLDKEQPDEPRSIGLRITDPTGNLVFNYVRPMQSQAARQG